MPEINEYTNVSIRELLGDLRTYRFDPSRIQRLSLDYLERITNGQVDIIDPTNPFIYLLEMSSVHTALAISESEYFLRKQYPALAQTPSDLYRHMSDFDYAGRFSTPSTAYFKILCEMTSTLNNMVQEPSKGRKRITIGRDSVINAGPAKFMALYPIDIVDYDVGGLRVEYDIAIKSPVYDLPSYIIEHDIVRDQSGRSWIVFTIPTNQIEIVSDYSVVEKTSVYRRDIAFKDQFYYARVFYRKAASRDPWIEMKTTHSDQVFDTLIPTALFQLLENTLRVTIPYNYVLDGLVSGEVRVDIYTTQGDLVMPLQMVNPDTIRYDFNVTDVIQDDTTFTSPMIRVPLIAASSDITSGGKNVKGFDELRSEVLDNAIGSYKLPITETQIVNFLNDRNYVLTHNVDVVTDRYFIASKTLPKPRNDTLVSSAVITSGSLYTSIDDLRQQALLKQNINNIVIPSNTLFLDDLGTLKIVPENEVNNLKQLKIINPLGFSEVANLKTYLFTPFYYVLDFSDDFFKLNAFELDLPKNEFTSFRYHSTSYRGTMTTQNFAIEKIDVGYRIILNTKADDLVKALEDSSIDVQLSFLPYDDNHRVFFKASLIGKTTDQNRVYEIIIRTSHFVKNTIDDAVIEITNGFQNDDEARVFSRLYQTMDLVYTSRERPLEHVLDYDPLIVNHDLASRSSFVIVHEKYYIRFGSSLRYLWTESRTHFYGDDYVVYDRDIPLTYSEDVYETDPSTGSRFRFTNDCSIEYLGILHYKGDPVLDANGLPVYIHRKGDPILDANGLPIPDDRKIRRTLDMTLVEASYLFATGLVYKDYNREAVGILTDYITTDMPEYNKRVLEKTEIMFYPRRSKGMVNVLLKDNTYTFVLADQKFFIDFYVSRDVYKNEVQKELIKEKTIRFLVIYFEAKRVSISEIVSELTKILGSSIVSLAVRGLGGNKNYDVVTVDDVSQLSLRKRLRMVDSGDLIVEECIDFNFFTHELKNY